MKSFGVELRRALDVFFAAVLLMFGIVLATEVNVPIAAGSYIPITDFLIVAGCATWFLIRGAYRWIIYEGRIRSAES